MRCALNQLGRLLAGVAVVCFFKDASALDPNRAPSQYVREQWMTEGDSPGGRVRAIAQTSDGYLWIGTDNGLVRFDGFNFRSIPFSSSASIFENAPVLGLSTGTDGKLLVRLQGAGVLRQSHGNFESVTAGPSETASHVTAMWSEPGGGILFSDLISGMLRLRGEKLEVLARRGVLPRSMLAISLAETPDGKIWIGTLGDGLSYLAQGRVSTVSSGLAYRKINCLLPVSAKEMWVGTDDGLLRWDGTALSRAAMPPLLGHVQVLALLRDRDSNIWAGTTGGLLRINAGGISTLDEKDLRGDGGINALFEDREGNIWVGGARGVERIRDSAFVTYSAGAGLPSEHSGPIFADAENNIWFAPVEGGLYRLRAGRAEAIRIAGLDKDIVYSITGRDREIWVGRQRGGLTRLRYENGTVASETFTEANGLAQNSVYAVYQSRDGAVWAGTVNGGVSRFKDGRFVNYTTASGLSSNTVYAIAEGYGNTIWVATPNGLNAWSADHWRSYTSRVGLPSDNVRSLLEDSSGVLWIGTSEGLASIHSGHIQVFREAPDSLHTQILGLAEDKKGWLWIATSNHVLQVRREKLSAGALQEGDVREYGLADGLRSTEGLNRNDTVIADTMGRIWFSMSRGLSVVDPSHLMNDSPPAIVHLEGVSADGNPINLGSSIRIPPSQKRITFSYCGLSLAQPERIRFRYFVEGFDREWSGPVAAREAVYTNLGPGSYKFRVIASNSNGIWNGSESAILFQVEPALWQTWWFRSACLLAAALVMLIIYRSRVHQLKLQMNVRFEERLAERTRIAQDLHDTLLQGFLSASMQLHIANDQIPEGWAAKPIVSRVLELMRNVINDGRNAVRGLRSSNAESDGLEQALSRIPQEFALQQPIDFRVIVEGQPRPLHPIIRDEVYRIGREALANAFRHSRASGIEVEVEYGESQLRILVRDNGCGIDQEVLRSGRDGHWGLSGIRERAERIGAKIKVWSRPAGGTEVELSVPAYVAFLHYSSSRGPRWFSRLHQQSTERDIQKQGSGREK